MGKWKIFVAAGLMIFLAGCAQQVEREPVSIKDEKAEMDPVKSQETAEGTAALSEQEKPEVQKTAEKQGGVKEQLAGITSLDEAPKELVIRETVDGKTEEKKLVLQKCDGGYGFYFPEHTDGDISWYRGELNEELPEEQLVYGGVYPFYSGTGMKMEFTHYEVSTLDDVKSLVPGMEGIMDVIGDDLGNTYTIDKEITESKTEECTIGAGNYPAIRIPKLTVPADNKILSEAALEVIGDGSTIPQMTAQYYFVEMPEGLLRIGFYAPADGMEESWADVDQIVNSMIIEDSATYQRYHSAVSVNVKDEELKFRNLQTLYLFYETCLIRGDYESAMKVSKNIKSQEKGQEVWEGMKCFSYSSGEYLVRDNRAVAICFVDLYKSGNTALPDNKEGRQHLLRYIYFVKEGDYWYLDGPLHNAEPSEAWWKGDVTSWSVCNYGLSDSTDPGIIEQNQIAHTIDTWIAKCK